MAEINLRITAVIMVGLSIGMVICLKTVKPFPPKIYPASLASLDKFCNPASKIIIIDGITCQVSIIITNHKIENLDPDKNNNFSPLAKKPK